MPNGSFFEPFPTSENENLRNTLDISKYVTCSAKTFSYWYLRSTSLKVVFLQQFIHLTAKLRNVWFTSSLSGPPVYDVLQGIPISTHPPGVEKSSFNTICGSGSWWSTPPSFNPHPPWDSCYQVWELAVIEATLVWHFHLICEWTPCLWCYVGQPNLHSPSMC